MTPEETQQMFREEKAAEMRRTLPIPADELPEFFERLGMALDSGADAEAFGCDHTLRFAECCLRERGLPVAVMLTWLQRYGGYCDCEVLLNVAAVWDCEHDDALTF